MKRIYYDLIEEIKDMIVFHQVYPDGEEMLKDLRDLIKRYDI